MIFRDDDDDDDDDNLGGFTYCSFQIRNESEDEATVTKWQLKSFHQKINQLLLASKNVANMNNAVSESIDICKSTTEKVDKIISETTTFMENYRTTYNNNTTFANEALQNLGSMFKIEKANLKVKDLLSERAVMRSCISDVTSLLLDIIESRDSMISIIVRKHLADKLTVVFAMLHRLQGVSPQSSHQKQVGEGGTGNDEPPKVPTKPIIKKEPKGNEKLIEDEPIIDDDEDEEPNEAELKRRKAYEEELNENQRIIEEAEEKEMVEKEAQATLKSKIPEEEADCRSQGSSERLQEIKVREDIQGRMVRSVPF
ncbi:unnamed protein product [Lactuca saligna]|uniref:Uncharacterized protein n=1 Tax=Lactuca saligna TaxID=75948 RepID=A0AA35Y8F2_LACSI|nr:unnamed protein product [Lactuca saligna]